MIARSRTGVHRWCPPPSSPWFYRSNVIRSRVVQYYSFWSFIKSQYFIGLSFGVLMPCTDRKRKMRKTDPNGDTVQMEVKGEKRNNDSVVQAFEKVLNQAE